MSTPNNLAKQTLFPANAVEIKKRPSLLKRVLRGVKYFLPDYVFLLLSHRKRVGRFPNLRNATTFNEIILDRCLHPDPLWTTLTDKLAVRDYVKSKVGEKYLIPLLAAPDVFTQEVFDSLPAAFVMKANHGCGFVKVVRDKSTVSFEQLSQLADEWLSTNFYDASRERHYRPIKPRIYFEKLLLDSSGAVPADFKMNIFGRKDGDPIIYTGVVSDRFGSPRHDFYDAQWNRLDVVLGEYPCSTVPAAPLPNWDEVVRIATLLADGLGYVRVDLYAPDNEIFFGELTFTPGAGVSRFLPDRHDYDWGRLIKEMPSSTTPAGRTSA
ncbi:ATP-grasp fold amidoligase family protein [Caballeronia sp. dw_276]|uniref:ATP-grasp fold amidoligase family protein n=1 Tax=Caballeronia sp. dw_276 TaxID=2719795 RepID=UPI001BD2B183|nr:ATP-grasp fold amidoligase family protein [Caballeronia sp. dw_276]